MSVSSEEGQGNARDPFGSSGGAISASGRYVAFTSYASNFVPGDTSGWSDVFLRDRVEGTTERVSGASDVFLRDRVRGTTELVSVSILRAQTLPYTGLPLLVMATLGGLLAAGGLVLRRLGNPG